MLPRVRTFKEELNVVRCLFYSRQDSSAFQFSSLSKMDQRTNQCEGFTSKANRYSSGQRASGHRGHRGGYGNQDGRSNRITQYWKPMAPKDSLTVSVCEHSDKMKTPSSGGSLAPEIKVQEREGRQQEDSHTLKSNTEVNLIRDATVDPAEWQNQPLSGGDTTSKGSVRPVGAVSLPGRLQYALDKDASGFDICRVEKKGPVKLNSPLFRKNRERRNELAKNAQIEELRPGMILLKAFLSEANQVEIVKRCQTLGVDVGGFYQPGYRDGSKLRLRMMCLGKDWDPETRLYSDIRSVDGAKPPSIPDIFKTLVEEAIQASHAYYKSKHPKIHSVEEILPTMLPDLCIVNFYTDSGKLGLHQDRDESPESIDKALPVVSFSIGDSADFAYSENRVDIDSAAKVVLESGDVLIFGGKSRLIFHGVPKIHSGTAPEQLSEGTNLRPGRLNLTFRQY